MKKDWSRAPMQVGTIRLRHKRGAKPCRMIKVRMDGPKPERWKEYARWWWEQNRGPVPAGKRVCHADGDTLNDAPDNLVLLTPGDVVFLAHERDPAMSRRNRRQASRATAQSNRERAACRRLREWLPSKWYPVDVAARVIHNTPFRKRWQCYAAHGLEGCDRGGNGRGFESAALGWPGANDGEAFILAALYGAGWLTIDRLAALASTLREQRRVGDVASHEQFISSLHVRGLIIRRGWGERSSFHVSPRASRSAPCPVVPIRGSDLVGECFTGFERRTPQLASPAWPGIMAGGLSHR